MTKTTELVPLEKYAIRKVTQEDLSQLMADNLGQGGLSEQDLTWVKLPSGGAIHFAIDGLEGPEIHESISGVIIAMRGTRVFWREEMGQGDGGPPDCFSHNIVSGEGVGEPGGMCATCPQNIFGSAKSGEGAGKACKESRLLFIMRPDSILPAVVKVTPGSLKVARQYFSMLTTRGISRTHVVTNVSLIKATNKAGIDYAQCVFKVDVFLGDDEKREFTQIAKSMADVLNMVDAVTADRATEPVA